MSQNNLNLERQKDKNKNIDIQTKINNNQYRKYRENIYKINRSS